MSSFYQSNTFKYQLYKIIILCELLLIGMVCSSLQKASASESEPVSGNQWLALMSQAMHKLNYQGTVVYLRDNRVETMKLYHVVGNGFEQERLVSLNDPMIEVIRDADKVTCYFPDTRTIVVDYKPTQRSFLLSLPDDLSGENKLYRVTPRDKARVTKRVTQIISIDPIDNLRYGRRIWIDIESKLPLKHQVFDEQGNIVEQMMFTSFSIEDAIPLKLLSAETNIDEFSWQVRNKESIPVQHQKWLFRLIPDGFKQILYTRRKMPASKQPVEHILLSDGFASVSVYIDQIESAGFEPRQKALGVVNSYSLQYENHQITVMGEVPAVTVKMIGDGIYFNAN